MRIVKALLLLLAVGCDRPADPGTDTAHGADPYETDLPSNGPAREGAAAIRGRVLLVGDHRPSRVMMTPECSRLHDRPIFTDRIVSNPDGTLRNVLVYIKAGLSGRYPAPPEAVVIDQKGCVYLPHVAVALVGQPVTFRNSDDFLHNVRIQAHRNHKSNFSMFRAGEERTVGPYRLPELGIEVGCDVHAWMRMYLHILRHPKFQVTQDGGAFAIAGLPAGSYILAARHEQLGEQTREIALEDGQSVDGVEFRFGP